MILVIGRDRYQSRAIPSNQKKIAGFEHPHAQLVIDVCNHESPTNVQLALPTLLLEIWEDCSPIHL